MSSHDSGMSLTIPDSETLLFHKSGIRLQIEGIIRVMTEDALPYKNRAQKNGNNQPFSPDLVSEIPKQPNQEGITISQEEENRS